MRKILREAACVGFQDRSNTLGIGDNVLAAVGEVLRKCGVSRAAVFGSRALGRARKYSDVDIAVFGDVTWQDIEQIKWDLNEIDTIFTFDVVGYELTDNEKLREHIRRAGVQISC